MTMTKLEFLMDNREKILHIAETHGAYNVRVFGSTARNEADEKSDVDILVDLKPGRNLLDLGGLLMDLQDFLHCRVDVITEKTMKPRMRKTVLYEAIKL